MVLFHKAFFLYQVASMRFLGGHLLGYPTFSLDQIVLLSRAILVFKVYVVNVFDVILQIFHIGEVSHLGHYVIIIVL